MSDLFQQPSFEYQETTGYVSDSDTSISHAQFEKRRAGQVQDTILSAISATGTIGATSAEVEERTGLAHQTVSSAIRNMELDGYEKDRSRGKVVKLRTIRNGGHAYIATAFISEIPASQTMEPSVRRTSWKKKLAEVMTEVESVLHYPEPFLANHLRDLIAEVRADLEN
jgi:predicted transcriptional regulator